MGIQSSWSVSGDGEEPMNRSSTTWFVNIEFDYDANNCTATIAGSDGLKKYTKTFSLEGRSFKTLKYWASVTGSGGISVSPSLSDLTYSFTTAKADAAVQIVSVEGKSVKYLAYDKNEGEGVLIAAAYDENGSLVFAESKAVTLSATPRYDDFTFSRSIDGYQIALFIWEKTNSLTPLGIKDKTSSVVKKLVPAAATASQEPEENNPASNSYDGDTSTVWASNGEQNIVYDLGDIYTITGVNVAFAKYDDARYIPYEVYISEDNINWETVFKGNSIPASGDFMKFITKKSGRYVKVVVKGNSISGWSSLSEVEIYGG